MFDKKYEYRTKKRMSIICAILMFTGSFYLFFQRAIDPNYVVEINGIILSKTAGLIFLYGFIAFSLGIVLIGIAGLISTFICREISISDNIIYTPKNPFSTKTVEINSDNIISYKIESINHHQSLVIKTSSGTVRIPESALPSGDSFYEILQAVQAIYEIGLTIPQRLYHT